MPDAAQELLATEVAVAKLGGRYVSAEEAAQVSRTRHVIVRNPYGAVSPEAGASCSDRQAAGGY